MLENRATLGGSSKYSKENFDPKWRRVPCEQQSTEIFEDQCGEGFHVNSAWTWVSGSEETGITLGTKITHKNLARECQRTKKEKKYVIMNKKKRSGVGGGGFFF